MSRYIEDAQDWASAKSNSELEKLTDWALLCRAAATPCPHGETDCGYRQAARDIFQKNVASVSRDKLAGALRNIIVGGPSKTTRVPFLVVEPKRYTLFVGERVDPARNDIFGEK